MIQVRITSGKRSAVRTIRVSPVTVGSAEDCDLSLPGSPGVADLHCRFVVDGGQCRVELLSEESELLINGQSMSSSLISSGDVLVVGGFELEVLTIRADEPTAELETTCPSCAAVFSSRRNTCPLCQAEVIVSAQSHSIGALTFPGYRIIRRIGAGGMGIVFEAEDLKENRSVALKVLRPHLSRDTAYLAQFVEEVRMLTSLRHPGIVQVYGHGSEAGLVYLTMELVAGPSARDRMRESGRLPWSQAVRVAWGAAQALNAAHQQAGVVHGDVKPANFLLSPSGQVKLCDFGLARVDLIRKASSDRAQEVERRGTAAYAAPERFKSMPSSTLGDIYSLGVSLFQMVTGSLPYAGETVSDFRRGHLQRAMPLVSSRASNANPAIQMLLERMMAKNPEDRHSGYPELIDDLALLLEF